ncbi:hypothetical protein [Brevibacillus reuszeri]|nr:hypothetical protein [Brevibacillus reuszeri]KNB73702.1 hypothetical protein ADS79_07115 [Brevibacillus reuszeri]MED1858488.1 hypothetical protein [Brevibacillus reuszeri]
MRGKQSELGKHRKGKNGKEAVIIINDQEVKVARRQSGAGKPGPREDESNEKKETKAKVVHKALLSFSLLFN